MREERFAIHRAYHSTDGLVDLTSNSVIDASDTSNLVGEITLNVYARKNVDDTTLGSGTINQVKKEYIFSGKSTDLIIEVNDRLISMEDDRTYNVLFTTVYDSSKKQSGNMVLDTNFQTI